MIEYMMYISYFVGDSNGGSILERRSAMTAGFSCHTFMLSS